MSDKRNEKAMSTTASLDIRSSSETAQQTKGDDGGGNAAAIAAGVTVPIIILLLVAGVVYWFYRKKYPVRMIMGRDFATFYNPQYSQNKAQHTLVREDADTFFQQTQPTGMVALVLGENDEEARVSYANAGFQYDTQDADEEEVEKRFRQQKAYLFKKHDDQDEVDHGEGVNGELQRDKGHDNAAFSGDSEDEGKAEERAKEAGDTPAKKDSTDAGSVSSDVSDSSKPEDKAAAPETSSPAQLGSDPSLHREGMTVRDFLLLAKEKRAHSDVLRDRAGSLTAFELDIGKSARRRAQSAGDIWSSALQATPPLNREELVLDSAEVTTSEQADSNAAHGTYENLADGTDGGKAADDISETASPDRDVDVKVEENEEEENKVRKRGMEDSYVIVDETASGSNESIPHTKDETEYSERNRTSSSTSDSSYEKVSSSQVSGSLQSSSHDIHGGDPDPSHRDEETGSSPKPATTSPISSPEQSSVSSAMMGSFESLGSGRKDTEQPVEVTAHSEGESATSHDVDVPASRWAPTPGSADSTAVHQSDNLTVGTTEGRPAPRPSPGHDSVEAEEVSPSSSLVMLDRSEVEDLDTQDNDSVGDEGYDKVHLEQEGALTLGISGPQPSAEASLQTQSGLHVLRSLSFSDRSSLSSIASVEPREDLPDTSHQQDVIVPHTESTTAKDTGESTPSKETLTEHPSSLSSDTDQPSQPAAASGGHPVSSTAPEPGPPLPTSPLPALLTLSSPHPDQERFSDSDFEDDELTEEDIQQALESSDDSSEELLEHQPPEVSPGTAHVKIQLTDKFVFSEEDDEDDDVDV